MGGSYGPLSKMQFRKLRRDGIVEGRQRRKCKSCGYRHTVRYRGASPAKKGQALELYLEGLGFRAIGRFLGCSHVAVYSRIGAFGGTVGDLRSDSPPDIVEMDEMHTCIGSKKTTAGYGLLSIGMEEDSSTAYWATAMPKQDAGSGMPLKTKRSGTQ